MSSDHSDISTLPPPPEVVFLRLQDEILATQRALETAARDAVSPLATAHATDTLAALRERRERQLLEWARTGLAVLMRGGQLQVLGRTAPPRAVPRSSTHPARVPSAPVPANSGPSVAEVLPRVVPPKGPPADEEALRALASRGVGPTWTRAVQSEPRDTDEVVSIDQELAAVAMPEGEPEDREELGRLMAAVGQIQGGVWNAMPRELQRAFVGNIVARARHLQDERQLSHWAQEELHALDRVFSAFTAFSKRARPGFVFGLMRDHQPQQGSWLSDAQDWWRQLVELAQPAAAGVNPERALSALDALTPMPEDAEESAIVGALDAVVEAGVEVDDPRLVRLAMLHMDVLRNHARFKRIRKAVRQAQRDDEASEAELGGGQSIPDDWPHWDQVRGKRAVIIGGDLRAEARARIQEAFALASLDWHTTDHARNVQRAASAVSGGSVELVIILRRFIGHDVDRVVIPACRDANVPWVSVERGYGLTQIRRSLERFLDAA